jgi:hypothetical protein
MAVIREEYNGSVPFAGVIAQCNVTRDMSNLTAQSVAIQILNSTGHILHNEVDFTSYNVFTSTCGEMGFVLFQRLFPYTPDLNMSTLICFLKNTVSKKTLFSDNVTLYFYDQP